MSKEIIIPVEIGGVKFKNPFYVASGPTTKTIKQLVRIEETGWAAASIKLTIDPVPYINRVPRYAIFNDRNALAFTAEKRLNFEQGLKLVENSKKILKELILFANITYAGDKGVEGWVNMAKKFEDVGADIIELNMCCPNMSYNMELTCGDNDACNIKTGASLGQQEDVVSEIVREIKKAVKIPLFVKLTPEGGNIANVAKSLYAAGADAVGGTANRLGIPPIDLENPGKSAYHLQDEISMSCHSGSWLKPLAQRDTYEIRKVNGPNHRIMATGGIRTYKDAIEMIMCGGDLLGICAETLINGYDFIRDEIYNLKFWMDEHGYKDVREMRDLVVPLVKTAPELTLYKGYAKIKESNLSAPCKAACPMHVPAQAYVRKVAKGEYKEAFDLITGAAPLQSVCGFVCNHECEDECTRGEYGRPVGIRDIKRFVLEYGKNKGWKAEQNVGKPNGKKAAVIGSGPSGMSNSYYLAKAGYEVTIFEREQEPGGILRYSLPAFRFPREIIDEEISTLEAMGIKIKTNCALERDVSIDSLKKEGFDVIFLGIGAQREKILNVIGEDCEGVYSALDFLRKVNKGEKVKVGDTVVVVGGGYAAIDSARTAIRLGAKKVYIAFESTRDEMTAALEEIVQAEAEGIKFIYLVAAEAIESKNGHVNAIRMCNQVLGEPSKSVKRLPVAVENAVFSLTCDTVIRAIGQEVESLSCINMKEGIVNVDRDTLSTNVSGVYIGGDAVEIASVIAAVAAGRKAAASMDKYLFGDQAVLQYADELQVVDKESVLRRTGFIKDGASLSLETVSGMERVKNFEAYIRVMTQEEATLEASRCLACGCGEGCSLCMSICCDFAITKDKPDVIKINKYTCSACGMCFNRCPNKNIEMVNLGEKV